MARFTDYMIDQLKQEVSLLRPMTNGRMAFSAMLLSIARRPSLR